MIHWEPSDGSVRDHANSMHYVLMQRTSQAGGAPPTQIFGGIFFAANVFEAEKVLVEIFSGDDNLLMIFVDVFWLFVDAVQRFSGLNIRFDDSFWFLLMIFDFLLMQCSVTQV